MDAKSAAFISAVGVLPFAPPMNKGLTMFETRRGAEDFSFTEGLNDLAMILLNEIGGSMGPIYGTIMMGIADSLDESGSDEIDLDAFSKALSAGLEELYGIVDARSGDKTLVDTLAPAASSLQKDAEAGTSFAEALAHMKDTAEKGRDSTKDMVAKYGRSSRLGERSRGVLDAGSCSCSCCLILEAMADGIVSLL